MTDRIRINDHGACQVTKLVLVNPIGLEDWKAKGVPSLSVDEWYTSANLSGIGEVRREGDSERNVGRVEPDEADQGFW